MSEQSSVETLREISARVAALQATLEEADRSADDAKAMSQQHLAESQRLRETLAKVNARLTESESNLDKQRALASMKDDALASMVEIYEKIQTYLGIDPGDMGERADGEILYRIHKLHVAEAIVGPLRSGLEQARAELAILRADKVDIDAVMAQNAEVDSLRAELDAARWRITELEAANES